MLEKFFAIVALCGFILFVGVLATRVDELNLYVIVAIGVAMAVYDFVRLIFFEKKPDE